MVCEISIPQRCKNVVEIRFGNGALKFRVVALKETVKKDEAATLYEIIQDGAREA